MKSKHFAHIPERLLLKRASLPIVGILIVGLLTSILIFQLSHNSRFRQPASSTEDLVLQKPNWQTPNWKAESRSALELYRNSFQAWARIPAICRGDLPLTEFQKSRCDGFWQGILLWTSLAIAPFLLVFGLLQIWRKSVRRTYQRAANRIARRRVAGLGKIVGPAPADLFSFLYGMRPMLAQSGDREVVVYLEQRVSPGQKVYFFEAAHWFGKFQWVAIKAPGSSSTKTDISISTLAG